MPHRAWIYKALLNPLGSHCFLPSPLSLIDSRFCEELLLFIRITKLLSSATPFFVDNSSASLVIGCRRHSATSNSLATLRRLFTRCSNTIRHPPYLGLRLAGLRLISAHVNTLLSPLLGGSSRAAGLWICLVTNASEPYDLNWALPEYERSLKSSM